MRLNRKKQNAIHNAELRLSPGVAHLKQEEQAPGCSYIFIRKVKMIIIIQTATRCFIYHTRLFDSAQVFLCSRCSSYIRHLCMVDDDLGAVSSQTIVAPTCLYRELRVPALHKVHPSLQYNRLRLALTISPSSLMVTDDESSARCLYEAVEGVERLENYRPGGYHPVQIVDHFHGRYRVVHKLGYGTYSTTWLARDEQSNTYVAVKVSTADSNPKEADIIPSLTCPRRPTDNDPGKAMIPSILDRFTIHGPNGEHACYVTSSARTSLSALEDGSWVRLFQLDVARALTAQLVFLRWVTYMPKGLSMEFFI